MTTRCHSVFSLRSPVALSRQVSEVATLRLAIGRPSWVRRISGSLPRFPTRITLFTLPAIAALHSRKSLYSPDAQASAGARHLPGVAGAPSGSDPIRWPEPQNGGEPRLSTQHSLHIAFPAPTFQFCSSSPGENLAQRYQNAESRAVTGQAALLRASGSTKTPANHRLPADSLG